MTGFTGSTYIGYAYLVVIVVLAVLGSIAWITGSIRFRRHANNERAPASETSRPQE